MRKLIATINMSIDGFCDHTVGNPNQEIHQHYADLLSSADTALFGRVTYKMMEYWRTVVENPTGNKSTDEFAATIDKIPKIVFSRTLKNVDWESASLATHDIEEEVSALKQQAGGDILACSPGLILALTKLNLIYEYQLCIHPVIAGSGLPLFKDIDETIRLTLVKTKVFGAGAVLLYYDATK